MNNDIKQTIARCVQIAYDRLPEDHPLTQKRRAIEKRNSGLTKENNDVKAEHRHDREIP